ncbi:MAG: hypothetical protein IJB49_02080 [Clostridia bacterium]|nr:hypothetical protein [Clostridia bacterium]
MKSLVYRCVCFLACVTLVFFTSCDQIQIAQESSEVQQKMYYDIDDFESIIVGKSTYNDICDLFPDYGFAVMLTSYGLLAEFPTKNSDYIHIKFDKNNIVFDIKVVENSIMS